MLRFDGGSGQEDAAEEEGEEEREAAAAGEAARGTWGRSEEERFRQVGQEEGWQKVEKMWGVVFL